MASTVKEIKSAFEYKEVIYDWLYKQTRHHRQYKGYCAKEKKNGTTVETPQMESRRELK